MDEIQTDAVLNQRVRGGLSDAEMGKGMTYEESIYKMLEQVLKNQKTLLYASQGPVKPTEARIAETMALLCQVKA